MSNIIMNSDFTIDKPILNIYNVQMSREKSNEYRQRYFDNIQDRLGNDRSGQKLVLKGSFPTVSDNYSIFNASIGSEFTLGEPRVD